MMATLFLPGIVTRIPLYIFWRNMGLLDTYIQFSLCVRYLFRIHARPILP
jgi:ABC-type glycerol-3-phosphate transport system permease component